MPNAMIGIFGGTFDPIHIGHLRTAIELRDSLGLDHIKLLPCHLPAHRDRPGASSKQRITMLELAVEGLDTLVVDKREAERDSPSYSVDTLTSFRAELPDTQLLFCMGMDAFSGFTDWYRWEAILEIAHLVVVDRPGSSLSSASAELLASRKCASVTDLIQPAGSILLQSVAQFDVSATRIRQLVSQKRDISYLVPEAVGRYVNEQGLYTD